MHFEIKSGFRALGTDINICIVIGNKSERKNAEKNLEDVKNIFRSQQKIFCRFSSESELSHLNLNLRAFQKASSDIIYLAERALFYNKLSGGFYDPRIIEILEKIGYKKDFQKSDFSRIGQINEKFDIIKKQLGEDLKIQGNEIYFGCRMDFSGIAKGYIADCAAKFLKSRGWKNFLIDSGGDMFAAGKNAEGEKWRIEIEGIPKEKLVLEITGRGIATSGVSRKKWEIGGKKFHHLINPKNPNEFSYEIRTVSVIEKDTENADGRAKVLVLLGKEKGMEFAKKNKIAAIFLDYKKNVLVSPEAKNFIAV